MNTANNENSGGGGKASVMVSLVEWFGGNGILKEPVRAESFASFSNLQITGIYIKKAE